MKLTTVLLFLAFLHSSAHGWSQSLTLTVRDAPMGRVFDEIRRQTGYNFFYNDEWLERAHPVSFSVTGVPLTVALDSCFRGQPFSYTIIEKTISLQLTAAGGKGVDSVPRVKTLVEVTGSVYNEANEPMGSANVFIKESKRGTITNGKGEFHLTGVPINSNLVASFIGYGSQEIKVSSSSSIKFVLKVAKNELDKIVVQAYGTTSQRLTTGSIATVTAAEIAEQPVVNPLQALQGRVAGLVVTQTSGYASAPFKVEIRGRNTINGAFPSDPMYIVDGVPLTVLEVGGNSGYTTGSTGFAQNGLIGPANGQSPLFSINPDDIESIEVLKDGDATAIYGSRGANGVILITTKKGKPGKTKLDIRLIQGESAVTKTWNMLNTPQYLDMRREAFQNDNLTPNTGNAPDLLVWDTTKYTNWQKVLWGGIGKNTNLQAAITGGNVQTQYRISAGYTYNTNILAVSGSDQRLSVSTSFTTKSLDEHFTANISSSYSFAVSNMISLPAAGSTLPPDAPPIYDAKGNLNYAQWDAEGGSFQFQNLKEPYTSKTGYLASSASLQYLILKNLAIRTNLGYNNASVNQVNLTPIAAQDPAYQPLGSAQFGSNRNINWIVEPQLEFNGLVGDGKINVLAGATIQQTTTDGMSVVGTGYSNDNLLQTISNAVNVYGSDNFGEYKYAAAFGRVSYNLNNRYIINVNARRDGSSRFGPGKQFGNFGSLGAAWIFSDEHWWNRFAPKMISFGKIRASYGLTGSDAVGDYSFLTRWSSENSFPYNNTTSFVPTQHANPDYHWATSKKFETAIDLSFLNGRVNLEGAWYENRCGDQLVSYPVPVYTGFSSVTENSPALVQNSGFEFLESSQLIKSTHFNWSINANLGINTNKLIAFPGLSQSPYATTLVVGQSLNIQKLLNYTGVDPQTGTYTFTDRNHDGVISVNPGPADDRFNYNMSPKYSGGIGTNFSYNRLQLSMHFYFVRQRGINAYASTPFPGLMRNQPTYVLARWRNPGDITNVAKFSTMANSVQSNDNFYDYSNGTYTDASFTRLQNAVLSYSLSSSTLKRLSVSNCSIFLQCQNLFVITKYKGLDPETQNFGGMPPQKIIVGGLSLNF